MCGFFKSLRHDAFDIFLPGLENCASGGDLALHDVAVGTVDADIVQVGAAALDQTPGIAVALAETGFDQQFDDPDAFIGDGDIAGRQIVEDRGVGPDFGDRTGGRDLVLLVGETEFRTGAEIGFRGILGRMRQRGRLIRQDLLGASYARISLARLIEAAQMLSISSIGRLVK